MSLEVSLRHDFPGFTLEAEFTAPQGVTALFGRSGSGKTSVVQAVAGLLRPQQGRIVAEGAVLCETDRGIFVPPHRRRIGYVFQDARLFPHLTVRQNLLYGHWFAPKGRPGPAFDLVVDLLGLGPLLPRRPGALSGGEKSRTGIGRAILSNPRLLLMDEPLAALDEARKEEILPYLERLRDELRLPILYVSHSLAEVARLATTVILLDQGRVTAAGPAAELLARPDLSPALGPREAGALVAATVLGHEPDGLTSLAAAGGTLFVPGLAARPGSQLRLRVMAQDVMLSLDRPERISALNVLAAEVCEVHLGTGPGAMLRLKAGGEALLTRVTRRSVEALNLAPGTRLFAVLKAVSVAPASIGSAEAAPLSPDYGWEVEAAKDA